MKINAKLLQKIIREELAVQAIADNSQTPAIKEPEGETFGHGGSARMVRSQLFRIAKFAQSLHDTLTDDDELPEWIQSKVAAVVDDIDEIHGHLDHKISTHEEKDESQPGKVDSIIDLIANLPSE